jgi:hypothetical protein
MDVGRPGQDHTDLIAAAQGLPPAKRKKGKAKYAMPRYLHLGNHWFNVDLLADVEFFTDDANNLGVNFWFTGGGKVHLRQLREDEATELLRFLNENRT